MQLNKHEKNELVENFHRFNGLKHSTYNYSLCAMASI
ncbi:hypothetical protein [Legionella massiliensis]